jgi:uncharacterized integral membrane protein (TIGR00698 family)
LLRDHPEQEFSMAPISSAPLAKSRSASSFLASATTLLPGLALCGGIALAATALHMLPLFKLFSPMIVAVVAGIAFNGLGLVRPSTRPGLAFAARPLLRFAIILLGFQLTLTQIREVGLMGMAVIVVSLASTLVVTQIMGRLLGVDRKLAQLIAAGTAICGASAIVATNCVTKADEEDVAYALACVTLCGTVAMLVFPMAISVAHLDGYHYGLWSGAAIHEVGQVVGAAFQGGQAAGEFGTIAKLTRVLMLAPVILVLGLANQRGAANAGASDAGRRVLVPMFIVLFLSVIVINSFVAVSADTKLTIATISTFLLTVALGAIGLAADVKKLRERGAKPLLLGVAASVFIAGLSLGLLKLLT